MLARVELARGSSDTGARLQSDLFNRVGHIVTNGKDLSVKNYRFSRKAATTLVISIQLDYDKSFCKKREPKNSEPVSTKQNQQSQGIENQEVKKVRNLEIHDSSDMS